jgi:hypothetical protein
MRLLVSIRISFGRVYKQLWRFVVIRGNMIAQELARRLFAITLEWAVITEPRARTRHPDG